MGWSLKGIIGGALVGGAGAAEKHFVAEDNMARELAAKKEMADYTSEIEFNKTKRLEEWRAANKDTGEMRERESISENTALASDAAIAAGEKPGTVGYHASMADFFSRSGRPELAEKALAEANRIRTDDTKDQIAAARLDAANARAARGGGGGGGSKDEKFDIHATLKDIAEGGVSGAGEEPKKDAASLVLTKATYSEFYNSPQISKLEGVERQQAAAAATRAAIDGANMIAIRDRVPLNEGLNKFKSQVVAERKARSEKANAGEAAPAEPSVPAKPKKGNLWGNLFGPNEGDVGNVGEEPPESGGVGIVQRGISRMMGTSPKS